MQIDPSSNLTKYIKHYLIFKISNHYCRRYRHFADSCNGLVINLDGDTSISMDDNIKLPQSFVFGQVSNNQDYRIEGTTSVIIIVFQPFGLFGLTGINAATITNHVEDATHIFGTEISELSQKLLACNQTGEKVALLNSFFSLKTQEYTHEFSTDVLNFLTIAYHKKGNTSVKEICAKLGISNRRIQRLFSEQIGISPKKVLNNIRLHSFLKLLQNKSSNTLTESCYESGYYDQAHLIREFKKTVGFNPSRYLQTEHLAVNLIQI